MEKVAIDALWNEAMLALDAKDEDRAIALCKTVSEAGDWRGSYTVGYVLNVRARRASEAKRELDREGFITAAHWYSRALSQGGGYATHYGLATYYYYGLGGEYDFKAAYEHLEYCLAQFPKQHTRELGQIQIMLGELLFLGRGTRQDLVRARELFTSAARAGYPAAAIGLSRIACAERRFLRSAVYYLQAALQAVRLVLKDKNHPLLAGTGGKRQTFRRDFPIDGG